MKEKDSNQQQRANQARETNQIAPAQYRTGTAANFVNRPNQMGRVPAPTIADNETLNKLLETMEHIKTDTTHIKSSMESVKKKLTEHEDAIEEHTLRLNNHEDQLEQLTNRLEQLEDEMIEVQRQRAQQTNTKSKVNNSSSIGKSPSTHSIKTVIRSTKSPAKQANKIEDQQAQEEKETYEEAEDDEETVQDQEEEPEEQECDEEIEQQRHRKVAALLKQNNSDDDDSDYNDKETKPKAKK